MSLCSSGYRAMIALRSPFLTSLHRAVFLGVLMASSAGCGAGDKAGPPPTGGVPIAEKTAPSDTLAPRISISTGLKDIQRVAVTPNGKIAAVVSDFADGKAKIQVWDLSKKQKTAEFETKNGLLALSPDGKTIASEGGVGQVWVADVATGKEEMRLPGIFQAVISPTWDAAVGVVETAPSKIVIQDFVSGKVIREWVAEKEFADLAIAVVWDGDRKVVSSGHADGSIKVWEFATGKLLKTLPDAQSKGNYPMAAVSADGKRVASVSSVDFKLKVHDVPTGKLVKTIPRTHEKVWLVPDGKTVLYPTVGGLQDNGDPVVVESVDGDARATLPAKIARAHGLQPVMALTPNAKVLVTASKDGTLNVWDVVAP